MRSFLQLNFWRIFFRIFDRSGHLHSHGRCVGPITCSDFHVKSASFTRRVRAARGRRRRGSSDGTTRAGEGDTAPVSDGACGRVSHPLRHGRRAHCHPWSAPRPRRALSRVDEVSVRSANYHIRSLWNISCQQPAAVPVTERARRPHSSKAPRREPHPRSPSRPCFSVFPLL